MFYSVYDAFWQTRLNQIEGLIQESSNHGYSYLNLNDLLIFGRRTISNYNGRADITSIGTFQNPRHLPSHILSLVRLIIGQNILVSNPAYENMIFTIRISHNWREGTVHLCFLRSHRANEPPYDFPEEWFHNPMINDCYTVVQFCQVIIERCEELLAVFRS